MATRHPDRLMRQFALHNRIASWRDAPAEHLFHLLAGLVLLAVLVMAAWPTLGPWIEYAPSGAQLLAAAALIMVLLALRSRADVRALRRQLSQGWLAASAWSLAARDRALREAVLLNCLRRLLVLWSVVLLVVVLRTAPAPALLWQLLAGSTVATLLLAWCWTGLWLGSRTAALAPSPVQAAIAAVPPDCTGLRLLHHAWRTPPLKSQRVQATLALLVLPGELSGIKALAVLFMLLALLWAGRCYRHYRDSCFAATLWLAATVLPPTRLGAALLPPLLGRLGLVSALAMLAAHGAGAPWMWLLVTVALLLAVLALNIALVLVHRQAPSRYRMASTTQTLSLLLVAQALPLAATGLWLLLAWRAHKAIVHPTSGYQP